MELKLIDKNGKAAKKGVAVSEVTFGREFNEALSASSGCCLYGECPYCNARSKKAVILLRIPHTNHTHKKVLVMRVQV